MRKKILDTTYCHDTSSPLALILFELALITNWRRDILYLARQTLEI
jgi:hypothetical protein